MSVAVSQNVNSSRPVVAPCPWTSTAIMFHLPSASPPRIGSVNCGEKKELSVMKGWRRRRVGKAGFGTVAECYPVGESVVLKVRKRH